MFQCKKVFTRKQGEFLAWVFTAVYGGAVFIGLLYIIFLQLS